MKADCFATAASAIGGQGVHFIADWWDLEAYAVITGGVATWTSGFGAFVTP